MTHLEYLLTWEVKQLRAHDLHYPVCLPSRKRNRALLTWGSQEKRPRVPFIQPILPSFRAGRRYYTDGKTSEAPDGSCAEHARNDLPLAVTAGQSEANYPLSQYRYATSSQKSTVVNSPPVPDCRSIRVRNTTIDTLECDPVTLTILEPTATAQRMCMRRKAT